MGTNPSTRSWFLWVLLALLPIALVGESSGQGGISGRWLLNEDVSDDLPSKMAEMRENRKGGGGTGGGQRGGAGSGGGRGGGMGGAGGGRGGGMGGGTGSGGPTGRSADQGSDREAMRERWESIEAGIATLEISWQNGHQRVQHLQIVGGNEETQLFVLDGKEHDSRTLGGETLPAKAKRKGDGLVVKWEREEGKIKETYQLGARGQQLYVTVEISGQGEMPDLELRRVYDRPEGEFQNSVEAG